MHSSCFSTTYYKSIDTGTYVNVKILNLLRHDVIVQCIGFVIFQYWCCQSRNSSCSTFILIMSKAIENGSHFIGFVLIFISGRSSRLIFHRPANGPRNQVQARSNLSDYNINLDMKTREHILIQSFLIQSTWMCHSFDLIDNTTLCN